MRKIKIAFLVLLFTGGFLFNGELYILYLDTFQESYYQSTFFFDDLPKNTTDEEIIEDFLSAGEKYSVDFFMIDRKIKSVFAEDIIIYGTGNAIKHIKSKGIREGANSSLFIGKANVSYEPFQKITNMPKYNICYYVGDCAKQDDLFAFKAALIGKYDGNFPAMKGSDRETWMNLLSVWAIIFFLCLLIAYYGVIYQKKETMVRIILGESLSLMFFKNVVFDICSSLLSILLLPFLLGGFSNTHFKYSFIMLLFSFFLILNTAINAMILRVNFKKDLAGGSDGKSLLSVTYALKFFTTILAILLLSGNVVILSQGYNLYKQRDFFERHKTFSFYQLNYKIDNHLGKTDEDTTSMNEDFYERFQARSHQYNDMTENYGSKYPVLWINRPAMKEIAMEWPQIAKVKKEAAEENYYILLPSNLSIETEEYKIASDICNSVMGEIPESKIINATYDNGVKITGIHQLNDYRTIYYSDPIIIFDNTIYKPIDSGEAKIADESFHDGSGDGFDMYSAYDTMYDIPEEDFRAFVEEYQLEDQIVAKSNVWEVYKNNWSVTSRGINLTLILSGFLLFLEIAMILFIVRMEYRFNAIEMTLMKIYGHSMFKTNERIITITAFSAFFGIIAALILSVLTEIHGGYPLVFVGLLLLSVEILFIFRKARKTQNAKMALILKGEAI